ncbi:hypothetical protein LCL97_21895 [Seohaeicola saemankumensis]|nr:hypothetical protein [Seohaeicola saemankumensis]MCA0873492.1 hypothetical protein [Seohaeicola saemankumensis]
MKTHGIRIPAAAGVLCISASILLTACTETSGDNSAMRRQYLSAREALEDGKYDKAVRGYAQLLDGAGGYEARFRLDYAHALLRNGQYAQAAEQARGLAASQKGTFRSAALAVQGTAEHELGMAGGGAGGTAYLKSAQSALGEVLKTHPELDQIGTIKARKSQLDAQLSGQG